MYVQSVDILTLTLRLDKLLESIILSIFDILSPCLHVIELLPFDQQSNKFNSSNMLVNSLVILFSELENWVLILSLSCITVLKSPRIIISVSSPACSSSIHSLILKKNSTLGLLCAHGACRFITIRRLVILVPIISTNATCASLPMSICFIIFIFSLRRVIHPP